MNIYGNIWDTPPNFTKEKAMRSFVSDTSVILEDHGAGLWKSSKRHIKSFLISSAMMFDYVHSINGSIGFYKSHHIW